ncbi:MAG: type I glutamate--ammonia ligase [Candidatus Melainabacteria bacterium]|nr:type I glutamate--ammonia ligase [Candidatus Melainabacteria bacterium]MBI3308171.1 type I glutamate--ammonia ligase [Candidatus Melainabacteria bacterium]
MSEPSVADVLKLAKDSDVKFIRLQFIDIYGIVKNLAIPVEQLEKALNNEVMLDGSSIRGFQRIEKSDLFFYPDKSTFQILPWRPLDGKVARLVCDIYEPDNKPFMGCPRNNLKRVLEKVKKELGYTMHVGPECEFFLFKKDEAGNPTIDPSDVAAYFDVEPLDIGQLVRREIIYSLEQMGFEIEASHHEVAIGQHEIDFKYSEALRASDNIATFRWVTKAVASKHGMHATFMPKPIFGQNGSGMHCNQSLDKNGKNMFLDESAPDKLSKEMKWYIGGLLKHIRGICAVSNPLVNSYKRLVPGYEAPVYIAWSPGNRSALCRVPAKRGPATRVELRSPDPAANPYLAVACMLLAGIDGIKNKTEPPPSVNRNIYKLDPKEKAELKVDSLPGTLEEALDEMEKSAIAKEALGEHIYEQYVALKREEWDDYRIQVTAWEEAKYLRIY